ncbi:hypothetical protein [Candidatus Marithrix sp. Canyon 246]|uniref:hypothetical protein n=2 Tax=Candidatus Marithrix sp. Canyon 246 TaxID=1827136 RepID=UPI00114CBEFF|nr:hypothetical protein [Candidatus Marithrix sp. Canyon 246]
MKKTMNIQFKDLENKTADDKIQLYLTRVEQLYRSIQQWLTDENLIIESHTVETTEKLGTYKIIQLSIKTPTGKWIALVKPNGASVIGGEGIIEIEGLLAGKEYLLYMRKPHLKMDVSLYKGINQDGWYWIEDTRRNLAHKLDKSLLLDIITLVSDYEF